MDDPQILADFDDLFNDTDEPTAADHGLDGLDSGLDHGLDNTVLTQDAPPQLDLPSLPPPPPTNPNLASRLDELCMAGCSQKISWSRMGSIASVAEDGYTVLINVFVRDPLTRAYSIDTIKAQELPNHKPVHETAHLTFSPSGSDLVVIDKQGGVLVHQMMVSLQRLMQLSLYDTVSADASGAVVACHWLDRNVNQFINPSATRKGDLYEYPQQPLKQRIPFHPIPSRCAALMLSRSGMLRMAFAQVDGSWAFVRTELDAFDCSEHFFTHAAMAPRNDSILIVASDTERTLRIYQVKIEWRPVFPPAPAQNPRAPQRPLRFTPKLDARPLRKLGDPLSDTDPDGLRLTHLNLVSDYPNPSSKGIDTLIAVYAVPANDTATLRSRIIRWQIHEERESLSSAFLQLGKVKSPQPESNMELKRLPELTTISPVVSARYPNWPAPYTFALHNGDIEFRDRLNLEPVTQDLSGTIQSAAQCGLRFSNSGPILHIAFSCSFCIALTRATLSAPLRVQYLGAPSPAHLVTHAKPILALHALMFTSSCGQHHSNDDVLALIELAEPSLGVAPVLEEFLRAANVGLDLPTQGDNNDMAVRTFASVQLQRCLSFQQALAARSAEFAIPGRVANVMLNVRLGFHALRIGVLQGVQPGEERVDTAGSVLGVLNWLCTLFAGVTQTIYTLSWRAPRDGLSLAWAQRQVTRTSDPSLVLLLASAPRFFFRHAVRVLRDAVEKMRAAAGTPGHKFRQSWVMAASVAARCPINLHKFETLLLAIDYRAREACDAAGMAKDAKAEMERRMLVTGVVDGALEGVAKWVLDRKTLEKYVEGDGGADVVGLLGVDRRILGWDLEEPAAVDVDEPDSGSLRGYAFVKSGTFDQRVKVDVLRKIPLARALTLWKRCGRCGSVMEDLASRTGMGVPIWLLSLQKGCICGVPFVIEQAEGAGEDAEMAGAE